MNFHNKNAFFVCFMSELSDLMLLIGWNEKPSQLFGNKIVREVNLYVI